MIENIRDLGVKLVELADEDQRALALLSQRSTELTNALAEVAAITAERDSAQASLVTARADNERGQAALDAVRAQLACVIDALGLSGSDLDEDEIIEEIVRLRAAENNPADPEPVPAPDETIPPVDETPPPANDPDPVPEQPESDPPADPVPPPVVVPPPAPSPGPTSAWPIAMPVSTSGITLAFPGPNSDVRLLPQTRGSDGAFVRGYGSVVYLRDKTVPFSIVPDTNATDGPARGVLRYHACQPGEDVWPAPGRWSANGRALQSPLPPVYPEARGVLSMATLLAADGSASRSIVAPNGDLWTRLEIASDDEVALNPFHDRYASAATVHWLCVPKDWSSVPAPPSGEYSFSEPIVMGSDDVHGVQFFTTAHGRPWLPMQPVLWNGDVHFAQIMARVYATPEWVAYLKSIQAPGESNKRNKLRPRGAGHRFTGLDNTDSWSYLATAFPLRYSRPSASTEATRWLHEYPLDMHMSVPAIGVGLNQDYGCPGLTGKLYDAVEPVIAVALGVGMHEVSFTPGRHPDGWSNVELFRIRDNLARYAWETWLNYRVQYGPWTTATGHMKGMWPAAGLEAMALISRVMPDYTSPQYGAATMWRGFADDTVRILGFPVRSALFGLIEPTTTAVGAQWNGGAYDQLHLCLGPTSLLDAVSVTPAHHMKAWMAWLDKSLPGAQHEVWTPLLCGPQQPAYRDAVIAKVGRAAFPADATPTQAQITAAGRAAVVKAAVQEAGAAGFGSGVLGLCLTEV